MFEDRTYDNILREVLENAPEGVSTRANDVYYVAVAGLCFKIAEIYADISTVGSLFQLDTAAGEYLDALGRQFGLNRNPATAARYAFSYEGTLPEIGDRFFDSGTGQYFTLAQDSGLRLVAETPGTAANGIQEGTPAIPMRNTQGMTSSTFGELIQYGTDNESDADYRNRLREKIAGPAENGNAQHYKTWCEQVPGVGRAHIIPLWDGDNTVEGVLFSPEGTAVSSDIVEGVQEYIDPDGTGLGNGVANIGAFFTAVSADEMEINVACEVHLTEGFTLEQAAAQVTDAVGAYLKDIVLNTREDEQMIVRIATVGSLILQQAAVLDYQNLTLNGGEGNIATTDTQAAVLGSVDISEVT